MGMVKSRVRLNIRNRMVLLCLGVATPLLAIGTFALVREYVTLKHEAERATSMQAATGVRTVTNWMDSQLGSLKAVAVLINRAGLQEKAQPKISGKVENPISAATDKLLATATVSQPSWKKLFLVRYSRGSALNVIASAAGDQDRAQTPNLKLESAPELKALIGRVAGSGKPAMADNIVQFSGKPFLLAATPVKPGLALVAAINPDAVLNLFAAVAGEADQSSTVIAVIDADKKVIARTIDNKLWQGKDFSQAKSVRAGAKRARGTFEAVGIADPTARVYAFDHIPENNWLMVVGLPTKTIYGTAQDWLYMMLALAAIATGVSFILAYWSTSHFTRTINGLVREALSLSKGDFSKRVEVASNDELGLLARAFNGMAETLEMDRDQKTMVNRISDSVRQSLDLEEILNTTVKELGQNLGASRCCLALIDGTCTAGGYRQTLSFDYVWWNEELGGSNLRNRHLTIDQNTTMGKIIAQGTTIWLDVLSERAREDLFGSANRLKNERRKQDQNQDDTEDWNQVKTLMACPIISTSGTIGLILVHQCDHLRAWSPSELELVEAVAGQVSMAVDHGRLYQQARTLAEQEHLINNIVRAMRTSLDVDTILDTATSELSKALGADRVQIAQPRAEGPLVVTHEHHHAAADNELESLKGLSLYGSAIDFHPNARLHDYFSQTETKDVLGVKLDNSQDGSGAELGQMLTSEAIAAINDVAGDSRCRGFEEYLETVGSKSLIAAPLINEEQILGLLIVHQCSHERNWSNSELRLVEAIADQLAVAIAHAQLFAQVRHQAITDGLTGLYNHVYFKNRLSEELRMAERKGTTVSLVMIDLDHLKKINDTYGHPVGDSAIRQIAAILKTLLRSGDTAARYGGEEFGVILPDTSLLEAALIADRLCSQIRHANVPVLGKITASLGTACYPKQARSSAELIEKADQALYVAKNNGRDQVRVFEEEYQPNQPTFINVTRDEKSKLTRE